MTYLADEQSVANSKPVELYRFDGTYVSYYYTSGPRDVAYQAPGDVAPITYKAISVERTEVKTGTHEDDGLDITVKMGAQQQVVIDYGFSISPPNLKLTVYRVQPNGTVVYWTGPVNSINVDDSARASLRCPSALGNALVGNVPNVYYQRQCNNVLGDARCKIDLAAWTQAGAISAIDATDPKNITVSTIGTLGGKLLGGELRLASGERRKIVSQVGTVIRVNYAFSKITVGNGCFVTAGCDHVWAGDCKTRFNNRKNFGGFMFIPPENPFSSGIDPKAEGVADTACIYEPFPGWWLQVNVDFWVGAGGPTSFPNHFLFFDGDSNGSYEDGISAGSGTTPSPTFWTDNAGAHAVQSVTYTFWQSRFPTDLASTPHNWSLRLQFPPFSVNGNNADNVAFARLSVKRYNEGAFTTVACTGGGTVVGGTDFGIQGLWPRDYTFTF